MTDIIESNVPVTPEPEMVNVTATIPASLRKDIKIICARRDMTLNQFIQTAAGLYLAELLRIIAEEEKNAAVRYPHPFLNNDPTTKPSCFK